MIETLFISKATNAKPKETTKWQVLPLPTQENKVLDPKKSQNIAILLRALNVTKEEVCEALLEGEIFNLNLNLVSTSVVLQQHMTSDANIPFFFA